MKKDLDLYLNARNLDALLITGSAQQNPSMYYFTGNVHLGSADLIKKRGGDPVLFCNPMERDEAVKTGMATRNIMEYSLQDLLKQTNGNWALAYATRYRQMLLDSGVHSGRVAIYGKLEAGQAYAIFSALHELMPEIVLVGEIGDSVLGEAMTTKDESEVARIRRMGQVTTEVVAQVADFITSHVAQNEIVVKSDGSPLTIGDVKARISLWLAEKGAELPEGVIFSIGRDAGVPHSSGGPGDLLRLGQTIVFDIYPCEAGGGYFYDFTRTWSLGYATDQALALYEQVRSVYNQVMSELRLNAVPKDYQERACELFEAGGHATIRQNPLTQEGYVHSLGHGLGLHVHEAPWFGGSRGDANRLTPGMVFTMEPGLYYPEQGLGVRLEDTVWMRPDGQVEVLAPYPMDLVLPLKK